jgi:hypothetical protein
MLLALNDKNFANTIRIARMIYKTSLISSSRRINHFKFIYSKHVAPDALRFIIFLPLVAQLMPDDLARILNNHLRWMQVDKRKQTAAMYRRAFDNETVFRELFQVSIFH